MERQSQTIGKIAAALAKAQTQFKTAEKDGDNPHYNSAYATIESVLDAVVPALNAQGIAVIQRPSAHEDFQGAQLETMLVHDSGEWLSSLIKIPSGKNDAHGFGSAYTYARRYALAAMCGIKQHDDDGNAAAEQARENAKNVDRIKKLPKDLQSGFKLLKGRIGKNMTDEQYRAEVLKIVDANNGDPEAIASWIREKSQGNGEMVKQGEEGLS